jgi:hypothetical protein
MPGPVMSSSVYRQPLQSAQQREADQHGGVQQGARPKFGFGNRVIGGFLMRIERDLSGELRRHAHAMALHMADMPRGQPEAHQQRSQQKRDEQN